MNTHLAIAERTLRDFYGIEGSIRALPGELDLNFDVSTDAGRYVLKLMRPDCDPDFVDLQIKAMECAAHNGMEKFVPTVIHDKEGRSFFQTKDGEGAARIGWLISFLPGRLMADLDQWTPLLAASIGETMARMCRALESFDHPLLDRNLQWDLRQGGWISEYVNAISNDARRRLIEDIAARFHNELSPRLETLSKTPIHGDANDMNLLVHADGPYCGRVSGVIDFGDMVRTPRICDLAIAMAYAMMGKGDALARGAALAAGFNKIIPLSDNEISLLLPLVKLRLAISVIKASVQRAANPDNKYLSVSEAPAWRLLEKLSNSNEATAAELFAAARFTPLDF